MRLIGLVGSGTLAQYSVFMTRSKCGAIAAVKLVRHYGCEVMVFKGEEVEIIRDLDDRTYSCLSLVGHPAPRCTEAEVCEGEKQVLCCRSHVLVEPAMADLPTEREDHRAGLIAELRVRVRGANSLHAIRVGHDEEVPRFAVPGRRSGHRRFQRDLELRTVDRFTGEISNGSASDDELQNLVAHEPTSFDSGGRRIAELTDSSRYGCPSRVVLRRFVRQTPLTSEEAGLYFAGFTERTPARRSREFP